jgi:uncharacterized LabA/DUF88 family protein
VTGSSLGALFVLIDYDNVDQSITRAGPIECAKILVQLVPETIVAKYDAVTVRLYGGWRENGSLTRLAQTIVPEIRRQSPTVIPTNSKHGASSLRLIVQLADSPIGSNIPFDQTLARERSLRRFRAAPSKLADCRDIANCGMRGFYRLDHLSPCANEACGSVLGDLLVRDEQKMVDTLLVCDIAHQAYSVRASDIVVVSSDTDIWPGIHLALKGGCRVLHVHPKPSTQTQRHLLQTLSASMSPLYRQASL